MKKLLSLLGTTGLAVTAGTSVVACKKEIKSTTTDFSILQQLIAMSNDLINKPLNHATIDDLNSLKVVIAMAQKITENPDTSQKEVNTATIDLQTALDTFNQSNVTDFSALQQLITQANELVNQPLKNATEADWTALKTAITTAQKVAAKTDASQAEVDQAINTLQQAITIFNQVNATDFSALQQLINNAEILGSKPLKHASVDDLNALKDMITNAQKVADNSAATQSQVEQATTDLQTALDIFLNAEVPYLSGAEGNKVISDLNYDFSVKKPTTKKEALYFWSELIGKQLRDLGYNTNGLAFAYVYFPDDNFFQGKGQKEWISNPNAFIQWRYKGSYSQKIYISYKITYDVE